MSISTSRDSTPQRFSNPSQERAVLWRAAHIHLTSSLMCGCSAMVEQHADPRGSKRGGPRADPRKRTPPPEHCICAHTEDRPLPRPAATPSHHVHMQVAGLSLCVSAVLHLAHHQGSCQAPSLLLHFYNSGSPLAFAHTCMTDEDMIDVATPGGLHAHAAHRVPTARADRPPCRHQTQA
jgi:hypothetical protein